MIFELGPFVLYRVPTSKALDISIKGLEDCGWEWGWRDNDRGEEKPLIQIRIGKLVILYIENLGKAYEFRFMGFWCIK